ncbi:PDZ domain-containing protein [Variovorax sp. PDNC026]|uniref:PDZ domain-containing protein n=1 Tax=Variovorax sp. PDNC026 TaxID=2811425 RepID=UPI001966BCE1|nr:PDZ domain-containing protein [Variovorax sp. PDNC026]QRY31863.1 PDZ domain-containing protein [Variovorax sp. PDNC026]
MARGLAALLLGVVTASVQAQVLQGFTFCTVLDAPNFKTYASPVFATGWHKGKEFQRSQELEREFLQAVTAVGGTGLKSCYPPLESKVEMETSRAEAHRGGTSARLSRWQDVAFVPQPWNPDAPAPTGQVTYYYFCAAADASREVRKGAATGIFESKVPAGDAMAPWTLAKQYTEDFIREVVPGLGMAQSSPSCLAFESMGEAQNAYGVHKSTWTGIGGFNTTFVDLSWRPTPRPRGTAVASSMPPATAPQPAPASGPVAPIASPAAVPQSTGPRGFMGARISALTPELRASAGAPASGGVLILEVLPGKAAALSGLQPADVVLEAVGQPITTMESVPPILGKVPDGQTVMFRVLRARKVIYVPVGPIQSETPALAPGATYALAAAPLPINTRYCTVQAQTTQNLVDTGVRSTVFKRVGDDSASTALRYMRDFLRLANEKEPGRWDVPTTASCDGAACIGNTGAPRFHMVLMICLAEVEQAQTMRANLERHKSMAPLEFMPE